MPNPFCFPCCGYYCDEGAYCPCSDCWKENEKMRFEIESSEEVLR